MEAFARMDIPPKVIAMYESVIAMINEGVDIHTMKVVDITKKAGIGKGTAYEYFSTKEEIIANALFYDTQKQLLAMLYLQEKEEIFEDKLKVILAWLRENFKDCRTFSQLIKISMGSYEISHSIRDKFICMHEEEMKYLEFLDQLLEVGKKQGVIRLKGTYECRIALLSQIMSFVMFLSNCTLYPEMTQEEAEAIALRNIMKLLRD
ncbi:TetR/AcrR family transcriptional regulator [Lachnospiraceae bacterium ZAX-1]